MEVGPVVGGRCLGPAFLWCRGLIWWHWGLLVWRLNGGLTHSGLLQVLHSDASARPALASRLAEADRLPVTISRSPAELNALQTTNPGHGRVPRPDRVGIPASPVDVVMTSAHQREDRRGRR